MPTTSVFKDDMGIVDFSVERCSASKAVYFDYRVLVGWYKNWPDVRVLDLITSLDVIFSTDNCH
tara:strand:- start:748 stop:939 length:192 start_codon:yes stop_codon:yes gene_type:complete